MRYVLIRGGLALLMVVLAGLEAVQAQAIRSAAELVQWSARVEPGTVQPGATAQLVVTAAIADGWKMYALDSPAGRPVKLALGELPQGVSLRGAVRQAPPREGYDPNFDATVRYFEGQAVLYADLAVAEGSAPGPRPVGASVQFMICNENMCLPPTRAPVEAAFVVGRAAAAAVAEAPAAPPAAETPGPAPEAPRADTARPLDFTQQQAPLFAPDTVGAAAQAAPPGELAPAEPATASAGGGLWAFLLLAAGAGLAALLTPCVFPMIPLTVSFFTHHGANRGQAVRMAVVYGLAIVLTFTGLGVLMALLVGAAGAQTIAANPWINLGIGLIFIVFALSLLGLFELRLPSGLLNYFNRQSNEQQGYAGVLFMGLTLTLVSFSCTAPFVGGLLAAAAGGTWSQPLVGMLVFSATFALPFVLFALFPNALHALPRSGAWMNTVKVVLGFVELAAALKFLSNADLVWGWGLLSRPLAIAIAAVIFFLAGLYLLGKLPLRHDPAPEAIGVGRLLSAIAFFGVSLFLLPGLLGAPLGRLDAYLPPRQLSDAGLLTLALPGTAAEGELPWIVDDVEAAFAQAEATGRPVFIDFTGYTCTNCREMEANVFPRPAVAERFARDFVLLRLYTDGLEHGEAFQRFQLELTGTVALPTYAIVDAARRKVLRQQSGLVPEVRFVDFLDAGRAAYQQGTLAVLAP